MFTRDFQLILILFSAVVIVLLGVYAAYCRKRAKASAGAGRLTDVEVWAMKANLIWITTFVLAFVFAAQFVLN
jgi:hypothetical protein